MEEQKPICAKCKEEITEKECVVVEDKSYHA